MHLSRDQQSLISQVNTDIGARRYDLTYGPCCCGADDGDVVACIDRYGIRLDTVLCDRCATLRFDPYLSARALDEFYRERYQNMYARVADPETYFAKQARYGKRLLSAVHRNLAPGNIVVEIGCGAGGALAEFARAGFNVLGCDHAASLIEFGQSKGLQGLYTGDIHALPPTLGRDGGGASLIFLHHVFEHLADPAEWLRTAKNLLSDRGAIVVAVPDITASDRYPSPDGDLRLVLHIAHKFNFTFQGLEALATRIGLQAQIADIVPSDQAPEMWVAFTRQAREDAGAPEPWRGTADAMWGHLRRIERDHLRKAVVDKLCRLLLRRPARN